MLEDTEENRKWLSERIGELIKETKLSLTDDLTRATKRFQEKIDSTKSSRNGILAFLSVLASLMVGFASLHVLSAGMLEGILAIFGFVLSVTLLVSSGIIRYWSNKRDQITSAYLTGIMQYNYLWAALYDKGMRIDEYKIDKLNLMYDFAKDAMSAQYSRILQVSKIVYGNSSSKELVAKLVEYADRGYQDYRNKRRSFWSRTSSPLTSSTWSHGTRIGTGSKPNNLTIYQVDRPKCS